MIEAMACGTPVVAFRRGSVPEVIDDGVTGFVVDTIDEAVGGRAASRARPPRACRAVLRGALHGAAHGAATTSTSTTRRCDARAPADAAAVAALRRRRGGRAVQRPRTTVTVGRRSRLEPTQDVSFYILGDVVARRRPHARAQARRDLRRVRPLRRHAAGRARRAGPLPRRHALPVAAASCALGGRRPLLLSSTVQGGQRSAHRRPDQPRPQRRDGQLVLPRGDAAPVPHASSCGTAPATSGCASRTSAATPSTSSCALELRRRLRRHLRGARHAARAARRPPATRRSTATQRDRSATRARRRRAAHAARVRSRRPTR